MTYIKNNKFLGLFSIILLGAILFLPEHAHATALASQIREPIIVGTWKVVLALINIFAILSLIAMAVINILRINLEVYNFRRMLPALILGIVLANFSHLICRFLIDFAQIFTNFFIQDNAVFHGTINGYTVAQAFGISTGGDAIVGPAIAGGGAIVSIIMGYIFASMLTGGFLIFVLLAIIIILIPSLLALFLALLMYVRLYIIWFLVIISPIAFFGLIFEPLKGVWTFWWGWFSKWLFLAPIGFFFLRLAVEIGQLSQNATPNTTGLPANDVEAIGNIGKWIFGLGMIFLAAYVPFSWGQNVFGALKGAIMRAGSMGWRAGSFAKKGIGYRLVKGNSNNQTGWKYRLGKGMLRDYGKAWEGYKAEIDKESGAATVSGGITKHIFSAGRPNAPYNAAEIQQIKDNAQKWETHAAGVGAMARDLDMVNVEQYRGQDNDNWANAKLARDRLVTLMNGGDEKAYQTLKDMYSDVDRNNLQGEDRQMYDAIATDLEAFSRKRVATKSESDTREAIPENKATQRREENIDFHANLNPADLAAMITQINAALTQINAGDVAGAKVTAQAILRTTPQAKINGMSTQELHEQLTGAMNDATYVQHIKTIHPTANVNEVRERARTMVHHEAQTETVGRDLNNVIGQINRERRTAGVANMTAPEIHAALTGTHANPAEQDRIRSIIAAKYQNILDKEPRYQLNDEAITSHLRTVLGHNPSAADIAAERTTRSAARNTMIENHINDQAANFQRLQERQRQTGRFDKRHGTDDQTDARAIFDDFEDKAY